jgi:hypothetical protein
MRQAPGVLTETAGDRAILLGADNQEIITLNPVGSVIWGLLDQDRDADELVALVIERFPDAPAAQVPENVSDFLRELDAAGLLRTDAPS